MLPLIILFICGTASKGQNMEFKQKDYIVTPERVELVRYNKSFARNVNIKTFKFNRTHPLTNASAEILVDLDNDAYVLVQAFKFMSNEYRHFPMRMHANMCQALSANALGVKDSFKCGNFKGCPLKKGYYFICYWTINPEMFPPFVPNGKYMLEFTGFAGTNEIMLVRGYGMISRPISYD